MSTQINRQQMIASAIKLGLAPEVAKYFGDSKLRQWVCNKGGVILSKAAVVADAESHIKKDNIIANLTVQVNALSNQPQANTPLVISKQNEIKTLKAENAKKDQEITQLKRQVANLQKDLAQSETDLENTQVALLLEKAKVAAKNKVIANLVEANKQALGFIEGM
jgi:chromosome segregation ATPase